MKLIVGLGNPGEKYQYNRHNVGFMFIDYIAQLLNCSIVKKEKLYITMKQFNNLTILLAKPQTFMNKSGEAVKKLTTFYRLPTTDLIVVHDDLDIPLGKFKIQKGTGPKLHNGLESIENYLHVKDFLRVRIGVDARTAQTWIDGEIYALSNFMQEEKNVLNQLFNKIFIQLKTYL